MIDRARESQIHHIVIPAVDMETSKRAIELAAQYDFLYAAVGIHPEAANGVKESDYAELMELAKHPKVVAIGEIGLDYHWDAAPRDVSQEVLRNQIEIARQTGLPIIIHNRDATQDVVTILTEECRHEVVGVMHCFTGSYETAKQCMDLGFFISFGGPVTFKNAKNVKEVASKIPDPWLLIETDAPYLTPHPYRGKRNEPSYVRLVAETLAQLRNQTVDEIAEQTSNNALRLFHRVR